MPDLVFIDGMHLVEFALRDFMHAEQLAAPHGLIVIDDIFPNHPVQAARERRTYAWTGDVWKIRPILSRYRPDLYLLSLDTWGTGLLLVAGLDPTNRVLFDNYDSIVDVYGRACEPPKEILNRTGAVPPNRATLGRLMELLKQLRGGKLNSNELATQLRAQQTVA